MSTPDEYLIAHIHQAIARDVGELGIEVRLAAGKVFLSGVVPSEEARLQIAAAVVAEVPGVEVHNSTTVRGAIEPEEVEALE